MQDRAHESYAPNPANRDPHPKNVEVEKTPAGDHADAKPALPALENIDEALWRTAMRRLEIIKPVVEVGPPYRAHLEQVAAAANIGIATLYRWLEAYVDTGDPTCLLPRRSMRRRARLSFQVREILRAVFDEFYATRQRRTLALAITQVQYECHRANISAPHPNSIRKHFEQMEATIGTYAFLRMRGEKKRAKDNHALRDGVFSGHEAPWSRVQVDHTRLDVMVVDEENRLSIGRPFITYAIDSYSRVILGFNISLDPTGRLSTGLCILHAMLPKDAWLKEHQVSNPWPCYGKPAVLHFDNGKEFLSEWIQKVCERYDIVIEHRPIATPHFGPHIERTIRTLNTFLRGLPGATFSNPIDRGEYDSEGFAKLTLFELEGLITEWITGTYHRRMHRGLNRPPQKVYDEAVLGTPTTVGVGRRVFDYDQRRLRLDFLPFEKRTVQHYGVTFDHLVYTADVLGPYVHATDEKGQPKRFYFHRDPRRINDIYFYADDVNEFYPLCLREPRPNVSLWEWRAEVRRAREAGQKEVDVPALFESLEQLQKREAEATERTKSARRNATRRLHHAKVIPLPVVPAREDSVAWDEDVEPFDDIRML